MHYRPFITLILIGGCLLMMGRLGWLNLATDSLARVTEPVLAAETSTTRRTVNFLSVITSIKDLARENAQLAADNHELESQLAQLRETSHENVILRQELSFIKESAATYLPAQLIGRSPNGAIKDLLVNRGSRDGVSVGQTVIAQGYLIGLVSHVGNQQSTITLLTHPQSIVPVMIQESRATGLLRGGIGGLSLTDLLIDVAVKNNDTVVTSGLGGTVPSGLPVGKVVTVTSRQGDITKKASVNEPIDISKLEMVFIRRAR